MDRFVNSSWRLHWLPQEGVLGECVWLLATTTDGFLPAPSPAVDVGLCGSNTGVEINASR
jgi:hypothetical protein